MGFVRFVNALERNQPLILVDSFVIEPDAANDSALAVNIDLTCFVHKAPDEKIAYARK